MKEKETNYIILYPNNIPTLVDINDIKEIKEIPNQNNGSQKLCFVLFNDGLIWQILITNDTFDRYQNLKDNK